MKIAKKVAAVSILAAGVFFAGGCTSMQEMAASQMEVPTVEKQANRVAIGVTIVRENNIMAKKFPLSADSKWPKKVHAPLTKEIKEEIKKLLLDDPYFATVHYTEPIQRKNLGSGALMNSLGSYGQLAATMLNQTVSPLTYRALYKIEIFYGKDPKNWPNIFDFTVSLSNFEEFPGGKLIIPQEAVTSDLYPTLGDALISLIPVNLKKDVENARADMLDAGEKVLKIKRDIATIETSLKQDEAQKSARKMKVNLKGIEGLPEDYRALSKDEIEDLKEQEAVLKEQLDAAESEMNEKQQIYFALLDQAAEALKSDIDLDDEAYVNLAKNINLVSDEIDKSATEAYTTFGIAAAQLTGNQAIAHFGKELETLAIAKAAVPLNLQDKYNKRILRLTKNVLMIIPNMIMGTYYAHKQAVIAQKYKEFTDIIVEAYKTKKEQEEAAKQAAKEEKEKLQTKGTEK